MSFESFVAVKFSHKNTLYVYLSLNVSYLSKDERKWEYNIKIYFMTEYECAD